MKKIIFSLIFAFIAILFLGSNAFGQITQRGTGTTATTTGATLTIAKPTGLQAGDVMLVNIVQSETGGGTTSVAASSDATWTLVKGVQFGVDGNNTWYGTVLYKVATTADVNATNFSFTVPNVSNDATVGGIVAFYNVDASGGVGPDGTGSGPFDVAAGNFGPANNSTGVTAPAITTSTASAGIVMFGMSGNDNSFTGGNGAGSWRVATNTLILAEAFDVNTGSGADHAAGAAFAIQPLAGTTGNGTVTMSNGSRNAGLLIALRQGDPYVILTPSLTQTISVGGSVNFTATAYNFPSGGNYSFNWSSSPAATIPVPNPASVASNTNSKSITFSSVNNYLVSVTVTRAGTATSINTSATTVEAVAPNSPFGCNGQFYVSYGPTSGANGNTLMNKLTFVGSNLTASSFPVSPGSIGFNSMGLNPIDGYIYAIRYPATSAKGRLVRIGNTGANQTDLGEIAAMATSEISYAGCFDENGDYYFTSGSRLMKITNANLASRTATEVAASGFGSIYDLAINPVDGVMYGTNSSTGANFLITVNKGTGAVTTIAGGNAGGEFFAGLFFDELGELYGYNADGSFSKINKTTAALTPAGSGIAYSGADGCSCSFGRVFHTLNVGDICPSQGNPNPVFNFTVAITNQSSDPKTGLTYTLDIPGNRFSFNQTPAAILAILQAAQVLPLSATVADVVISSTSGLNNKLVVTGVQTGAVNTTLNFTLQLKLVTLGGTYSPVPLQSSLSGLPASLGSIDLSNDPLTPAPDDPSLVDFCTGVTLPVTLLSFTGTYANNNANLDWTAENEINFSFYVIERSYNGIEFSSIGSKAAQASTSRVNYGFVDDISSEHANILYYRLKMVDIDGSYKYSSIIVIRKEQTGKLGFTINPNPIVRGGIAAVIYNAPAKGTVDFKVIDMAGRIVATQRNNVAQGNNSIAINSVDRLQPGTYVLQMNDGAGTQTAKFTIAR